MEYLTIPKSYDKNSISDLEQKTFLQSLVQISNAQVVMELGVAYGDTAIALIEAAKQTGGTYIGVDAWDSRTGKEGAAAYSSKEAVENRLGIFPGYLFQTRTNSKEFKELIKSLEFIDFCFIDANHHYDYVKNDFYKVWPKISPGGLVVFHDTYQIFGVRRFIQDLKSSKIKKQFQIIDLNGGTVNKFGVAILQKKPNKWEVNVLQQPQHASEADLNKLFEDEMRI